jgi:hypothetical protein
MSVNKLVLPNYADKKLQICKMSKLQIFVITNIYNQIFVTFGRIVTWFQVIGGEVWLASEVETVACFGFDSLGIGIRTGVVRIAAAFLT